MNAVANTIEPNALRPANDSEATLPRRFLEALDIGVLLASLLIFLLFITLLIRVVFPEGTSLGDVSSRSGASLLVGDRTADLDVESGAAGTLTDFIAKLGDIRKEVKIRPADSVAWQTARQERAKESR